MFIYKHAHQGASLSEESTYFQTLSIIHLKGCEEKLRKADSWFENMRKQLSSWFLFHNSKAGLFLIWGHLPWKKITFGFTLRKWAKCKGWPKGDIKVYTACMLSIEKLSDFFVPKMVRLGIFSAQRVGFSSHFWPLRSAFEQCSMSTLVLSNLPIVAAM